jgi:hypothetical protein
MKNPLSQQTLSLSRLARLESEAATQQPLDLFSSGYPGEILVEIPSNRHDLCLNIADRPW